MEIIYSEQAQEDIAYWEKTGNRAVMKRISALIADIEKHPFIGLGKPEASNCIWGAGRNDCGLYSIDAISLSVEVPPLPTKKHY